MSLYGYYGNPQTSNNNPLFCLSLAKVMCRNHCFPSPHLRYLLCWDVSTHLSTQYCLKTMPHPQLHPSAYTFTFFSIPFKKGCPSFIFLVSSSSPNMCGKYESVDQAVHRFLKHFINISILNLKILPQSPKCRWQELLRWEGVSVSTNPLTNKNKTSITENHRE